MCAWQNLPLIYVCFPYPPTLLAFVLAKFTARGRSEFSLCYERFHSRRILRMSRGRVAVEDSDTDLDLGDLPF